MEVGQQVHMKLGDELQMHLTHQWELGTHLAEAVVAAA